MEGLNLCEEKAQDSSSERAFSTRKELNRTEPYGLHHELTAKKDYLIRQLITVQQAIDAVIASNDIYVKIHNS